MTWASTFEVLVACIAAAGVMGLILRRDHRNE